MWSKAQNWLAAVFSDHDSSTWFGQDGSALLVDRHPAPLMDHGKSNNDGKGSKGCIASIVPIVNI
jgi:hypothetical protein